MVNINAFAMFFKSLYISKIRLEHNAKFDDRSKEAMNRSNFHLLTSKSKRIGERIDDELVFFNGFVKSMVKYTKTNDTSVLD